MYTFPVGGPSPTSDSLSKYRLVFLTHRSSAPAASNARETIASAAIFETAHAEFARGDVSFDPMMQKVRISLRLNRHQKIRGKNLFVFFSYVIRTGHKRGTFPAIIDGLIATRFVGEILTDYICKK